MNPLAPRRFAHVWMTVTVILVALALAGATFYALKAYQSKKSQTKSPSQTTQQQPATKPAEEAKSVANELKDVNLAELKSSVGEIKSILAAF